VYVNNDPLVLAHARALLTSSPARLVNLCHAREFPRLRYTISPWDSDPQPDLVGALAAQAQEALARAGNG
jgi:hypothetical protein